MEWFKKYQYPIIAGLVGVILASLSYPLAFSKHYLC